MDHITEVHRRRAFALMGNMLDQYEPPHEPNFKRMRLDEFYNMLKRAYNLAYETEFTLKANACDLEECDRFLEFIIEIALGVGMQFKESPINCFNNTDRYLILMIKNRTCCITGRPNADLHHCDCIGMGNNRDDADNSKIPRMALSREKHEECHRMGQAAFEKLHHVHGVLCNYHNDVWDDGEPQMILAHQNVIKIAYSDEKQLLGVRFKQPVPGCDERNLIYYRMTPQEWETLSGMPDPKQAFINSVYGQREIVDI